MRPCAAKIGPLFRLSLAFAVILCFTPRASAQSNLAAKRAAAKEQFDRAERARAASEAKSVADRTLADYQRVVTAYRRVYYITPRAAEVPAALVAVAQLYREMGGRFDAKYFQSAVDAYQFLLHEYPANRYREEALLTIGKIEKDDQQKPELAQKTFEEFLRLHPKSSQAPEARAALAELAAQRAEARKPAGPPQEPEQRASPRAVPVAGPGDSQHRFPRVTQIRTWNASDHTRVVVDLEDAVQFDSARIKEPDRIYFDLHQAKLNPDLSGKTLDIEGGFLKAVRVAQNQAGVVRVVLDVNKVKGYSANLLQNPYRLVVDVYGEAVTAKAVEQKERDLAPRPRPATPRAQLADVPPPTLKPEVKKVDALSDLAPPSRPESPAKTAPIRTASTAPPKAGSPATHRSAREAPVRLAPPLTPQPTKDGDRSLTRALGLKIGRIVIDAGHGGHDTGTIGHGGLMEKDLCLDVALRLGKLIAQKLPGAEVVYTRQDDTFIPLEDRTAIANRAQADLFISIHANSSPDRKARGVETYYLNFATSPEALDVAARENATSQGAVHELQELVKKIAQNDKIEESRELASDIQVSLTKRLQLQRQGRGLKDRGVRKAPFVVLIGADMPSVLSEISFLSNPSDEQFLKKPDGRQKVAEGLYRGVESYLKNLNSITYNQPKASPDAPR